MGKEGRSRERGGGREGGEKYSRTYFRSTTDRIPDVPIVGYEGERRDKDAAEVFRPGWSSH